MQLLRPNFLRATAAQARDATNNTTLLTPASLLDCGVFRLLFTLIGANMNVDTDQVFTKVGVFITWLTGGNIALRGVWKSGASLTTAAGGIYSAASKGGDALWPVSQTYTGLAGAGTGQSFNPSALGLGVRNETPVLSLTTPQGAAVTADFYIFGVTLS